MQPTPDTLVSFPLCSLCSKHLQTGCAGAANLRDGFIRKRKGKKERKKRGFGPGPGQDVCDATAAPVLAVEPCGTAPGGTPWGVDRGSRCLLDTEQGG